MTAAVEVVKTKYGENSMSQEHASTNNNVSDQGKLNEVVKCVVDDLVQDVVFAASLREEKRKVQGLINNLVSKVRDEAALSAANAVNSVSTDTPSKVASARPATPMSGIPFGDHRRRHVGSLPVAWMQTMDSLTLNITVPSWVRKQNVSIKFTGGSVKVTVVRDLQSPPIIAIDEPLVAKIDTYGCTWALEDAGSERQLTLELEKGREQWWARLFMGDDPKLYTLVDSLSRSSARSNAEERTTSDEVSDVCAKKSSTEDPSQSLDPSAAIPQADQNTVESVSSAAKQESTDVQSLEQTVTAVVNQVVDSVASTGSEGKNTTAVQGSHASSISRQSNVARQPRKKILTEADLLKLVEQYREEFRKAGPSAAEAAIQLGTFYQHGIGVEKNDAEAARMYRFGLENGALDSSAAFQLGIICNHGAVGMEPNPTEAVQWWRVAASLGNSVAMFNLGVMAMNGSGCDMDPIAALRWWQKATALNPQLRPPPFSQAQIEERIATAAKEKKLKMKAALPPEERKRRRDEALQKARVLGYTSAGILGLGLSVVAIRYWWRNRL